MRGRRHLSNDCSFAGGQVFAQVTDLRQRRHRPAGTAPE